MILTIFFYVLITLFIIFIFVLFFLWSHYNHFVVLKNQVKTDFSDIEIQLKRRTSLIERLASLVKEYATHEEKTFTQVAKARSMVDTSTTATEAAKADNFLTQTLRSLAVVVESYPKLQANQGYIDLQEQLEETEDSIASYREAYNQTVQNYNNSIQTFPALMAATIFGFNTEALFSTKDA